MTALKELNGIKIYVSQSGEFYCNPATNNEKETKSSIKSAKLASLEKAINEFKKKS